MKNEDDFNFDIDDNENFSFDDKEPQSIDPNSPGFKIIKKINDTDYLDVRVDVWREKEFKLNLIYILLNEVDKFHEYDFEKISEIILDPSCNTDIAVPFYFELLNIALTSHRLSDKAKIYYATRLSKFIFIQVYE